ncbi:ribosome assembly cofactor RimP [Bergeyella cardium]|uniref:Ribosome maturation factor RimP n=1 Tax=Bergeyella cardium TaxID=1585976 RepID=A0A6P1QTQ2_9FLAO|nr:ribosome assembly cofactor RimP [Bergeyella cardium]QHN64888.1 ribosome assembly cofactor RimP [Bergeyella cardium]WHE34197.1 ribosome assembly cofactor RimP [Bergeyella cardium]WHF60848.1 ribosome assembly cofactor RimP [Bergeyella cardium]
MMFKEKVEELLNSFLQTREDLFLIDLKISAANDITVILDGDKGVSIQDCLDASRAVENNLDREEQDFSLQVMSAGLTEPLTQLRQYQKNIGREVEITFNEGEKLKGELLRTDATSVTLLLRYRKPKDIGKGKIDVEEERTIPLSEIKKALIVIKF